jgi:signal peptidase II
VIQIDAKIDHLVGLKQASNKRYKMNNIYLSCAFGKYVHPNHPLKATVIDARVIDGREGGIGGNMNLPKAKTRNISFDRFSSQSCRFFALLKVINLKKRSILLIILAVLVLDQWLKFYIKTNYEYGQETNLFGLDWARLRFVENEGMAFGITLDWTYGKLLLTTFRILMVTGLFYYIYLLRVHGATMGFIASVSLITAGAIGNILDSVFYGMIFSESGYHGGLASLTPWGQGYGTLLHGKVVDMFYFPIHNFQMPDWLPLLGGENFLFFSPIFNVADAAITCGVLSIFMFQRQFFKSEHQVEPTEGSALGVSESPAVPEQSEEVTLGGNTDQKES